MRRQTSEKASGALLWGDGGCFTELYDIEYLTDIQRDRTISIPGGGAVGDRSGAEAGLGNALSKSRGAAVFQEELTDKLFTYFFPPPDTPVCDMLETRKSCHSVQFVSR
jgi:hypothetical protein